MQKPKEDILLTAMTKVLLKKEGRAKVLIGVESDSEGVSKQIEEDGVFSVECYLRTTAAALAAVVLAAGGGHETQTHYITMFMDMVEEWVTEGIEQAEDLDSLR